MKMDDIVSQTEPYTILSKDHNPRILPLSPLVPSARTEHSEFEAKI